MKLTDLQPIDTKEYYWGVVFQCNETVSLAYSDHGVTKRKCINWAANAEHMTLVQVNADGRLKIIPVYVEGKSWKASRMIPEGVVQQSPMSPAGLNSYITSHYDSLYGVWDRIDQSVKTARENTTARINALNVMNDEEVKVSKVIGNVEKFIKEGNVPPKKLEYNKDVRKALMKRIHNREKEQNVYGSRFSKPMSIVGAPISTAELYSYMCARVKSVMNGVLSVAKSPFLLRAYVVPSQ